MNQSAEPIERLYITRDPSDSRTESGLEILRATLGAYAVSEVADPEDAQAMIALGGDGGFLKAIRRHDFMSLPIAGISTGTLGYYTSTTTAENDIDYLVRNLAEGDYHLRELPLLEIRRIGGELVQLAVNDIIVKADKFQAFKAGMHISGTHFEHFVGTGLAFSTPQGSSGESVANGGMFIREGLPVWSVTPEAPHPSKEYHSLVAPMILGSEDEVIVEVKEAEYRPFVVGADGVDLDWPQEENQMRITQSQDKFVRRIRLNNNSYLQDVSRIFRGERSHQ